MKENQKQVKNVARVIQMLFSLRLFFGKILNKIGRIIDKRPLTAFFVALLMVVSFIFVGNLLRTSRVSDEPVVEQPKQVSIFSISQSPRMNFSGVVEKSGAVSVIAQSAGVVQYVNLSEGNQVYTGQNVLGLATTYGGASLPSGTRQIAEQSYQTTEANHPALLEIVRKRRELAETLDAQADQLRDIGSQSISDTKNQLNLNKQILTTLDSQIKNLEDTNVGGNNDELILQTKQAKSGVLSGVVALRSAIRSIEYQSSGDEETAKLSNLGKDITLKQLEIEERSLNLSKEIALLNLRVAQIAESLLYPVAPSTGIIERVFVTPGQAVNPGTPLFTMKADKNVTNIIVHVSGEIAKQLSRLEPSRLSVGSEIIEIIPRYITTEPTDGQLHSVIYTLPTLKADLVADGSRIQVEISVGQAKSTASVPYVPIDAVFQTENYAIVYAASQSAEGKLVASSRTIDIGPVFGSYVPVLRGINPEDQIILNRDILSGDEITF